MHLQGDIVAILDSNKNVVVSYVYDAWGRPISKTGNMAGTLGTVQPFRYRGYVYDEETGLYYLRNRYFSSVTLCFISADSILFGPNAYCYCENNPISRYDPNGHQSVDASIPWNSRFSFTTYSVSSGGGAVIGAGISAVGSLISEPVSIEQIISNSWTAIANSFIAAGDMLYRYLFTREQTLEAEIVEAITALPAYAALEEALVQAKSNGEQSDKTPKCDTNKHHIIAQGSHYALPAFNIWTINCHLDIHADEKLVSVSTQMHWFMHQEAYYTSVNALVSAAYHLPIGTPIDNVKCAVKQIKKLIQTVDKAIPQ